MNATRVARFPALGSAAVVAARGGALEGAVEAVRGELEDIDRTCSRFREDSDLSRANRRSGEWTEVDPLLVEAVEVALRAARITDGLVDPTVGGAMIRLGYDRDLAEVPPDGPSVHPSVVIRLSGWRHVGVDRARSAVRVPPGALLDLGATAKALAADRAAARAAERVGGSVLVSLGGDVAIGGPEDQDGWPIGIADDHAGPPEPGETIRVRSGAVATSSTTVRTWRRGGRTIHHVVDPRTGMPAEVVWRTVSVCAATCVDANTASTAGVVLGTAAPAWLARGGLPARLVRTDGTTVRVAGWPEAEAS